MNILFVSCKSIGDSVLASCVLDYCFDVFPSLQVTVLSSRLSAPLYEDLPFLKECIVFKDLPYHLHWFSIWKKVKDQSFDFVIDFRGSVLSYFLKTQQRRIWSSRRGSQEHKVLQILDCFSIPNQYAPRIWLDSKRIQKALEYLPPTSKYLAVAPTSSLVGKTWPLEFFKKTCEEFLNSVSDAKVVIFAAPGEASYVAPLIQSIPKDRCVNLVDQGLGLLDIAASLKLCTLFLGNDSGLMHMCAALDVPTLVLFGPTDDSIYAPYKGPLSKAAHTVIRTPESFEAITKSPNYSKFSDVCFMKTLDPKRVISTLLELF